MKLLPIVAKFMIVAAAAAAAVDMSQLNQPVPTQDSDEAVVYPANVDQSWIDAGTIKRSGADSDEAVVYPASIDQSWVDGQPQKRSLVDSDEAVVYPASIDQSWIDADNNA